MRYSLCYGSVDPQGHCMFRFWRNAILAQNAAIAAEDLPLIADIRFSISDPLETHPLHHSYSYSLFLCSLFLILHILLQPLILLPKEVQNAFFGSVSMAFFWQNNEPDCSTKSF